MKLMILTVFVKNGSAAFGRLCVETGIKNDSIPDAVTAAFGRLCVETLNT